MIWPFKRKNPPVGPKLRWVNSDASFREHPDLVGWAAQTLRSSEGRALQAYLFSGIPQSVAYRGDKIDAIQAGHEYFRLLGYLECLSRLQQSGQMIPLPPPEIEPTYEDPVAQPNTD